jgi:outer membrane lipoprotein carrier protein
MRPFLALVCALCLVPCAPSRAQQSAPAASELARRIQAHYDTVRDFTAEFTHSYKGGALRQTYNERGDVRIKKPGRMYWTYIAPEKKEFVSDGSEIFSYMKADRIVYVTPVPPSDQASTAVLFLAGKGNLTRDFRASAPAKPPADAWQLDLTPKTPQSDFTSLSLVVDPKSLSLRGLTSVDGQGGTHVFTFTKLRENVGLSDNQFAFKIPKGVEVRR